MKQTLTDDEIEVYQDFDLLIKQTRAQTGKWIYYAGGIAIIATVVVLIWWSSKQEIIRDSVKVNPEPLPNTSEVIKPEPIILVDSAQAVIPEKQPLPKKKAKKPDTKTSFEDKPKAIGYKQAEPAGGYEKLYHYFNQELHYPESAVRDSIQGVVVIDFVIMFPGNRSRFKFNNRFTRRAIPRPSE